MATNTGGEGADWDVERVGLGRHFLRDMESLWEEILKLAAVVENALSTSVRALCEGRPELAAEVDQGEQAIDDWEVKIERECLRILALHQPVASDLRRVAAVLKINSDLERMADLAAHIAKRARKLATEPNPVPIPARMETLGQEVLAEVHDALDALAKGDAALARAVIASDRRIDLHRQAVVKELKQAIRREPQRVNTWLRLINTARNLERVADHATNIAEDVVYLKEGDIIRHVGSHRQQLA
ncbi:MAG: phosphate signaling complex protein PhoU [Isosphaeraceae bacterium]|nr:phosphate signaling complex protein PhoU [Isosphaeraceae bacterium]